MQRWNIIPTNSQDSAPSKLSKAETCKFKKINTPPWVFFTFFKLYKCDQIAQRYSVTDT